MQESVLDISASTLTPAWFTSALRETGLLDHVSSVVDVQFRSIGAGMVGDSVRFTLSYDHPGAGPATLAAKFPAQDSTSRRTAVELGLYESEVGFYKDIAPHVAIRAPQAIKAEMVGTGGDFILLLEDVAPARGGDQLAGCSIEDARHVMRQAAALHGPTWDIPRYQTIDWLNQGARQIGRIDALLPAVLTAFQARYEGDLGPDLMGVCTGFVERRGAFFNREHGHLCVIHGDLRLDNLLFDIKGGSEPVAVLDWQTAACGNGIVDVGYFLGAGLPSEFRRSHERELLSIYLEALREHGVRDYDFDTAWQDYRVGMLQGVLMPILAASSVERTVRGDAMFLSMAKGACQLAIDIDALAALSASR